MTRNSRRTLTITGVLVVLAACEASPVESDSDSGVLEQDTGEIDTGDAPSDDATLVGSVSWEDGSPATIVQVRLCYVSCSTADPDEFGQFVFSKVTPGPYTLQLVRHGDRSFATPHGLVNLAPEETRTLDPIVVPLFQSRAELTDAPVSVDIHGGLTVEADPSTMTKGPYSFSDEIYVSAVKIDPSLTGIPVDGIDDPEAIVGMWYLGAYDFQLETPWPFTGVVDLGLPEGATVQLRTASNDTKTWLDAGTATIGPNQTIASDPGGGINQLTTLVLVASSASSP